jgi:glycerol-3-phosphate acyltransferase PlsY|tara:strand:+ start:2322 stop:3026 length:705 start_codon:yes stop_codon:yes gene_type:complete
MEQVQLFEILGLLIAYLLGSIPTAVWVGRIFYGKDVREFGSGNAGATNTFRVLGKKAGIPVLLFDILKGSIAVYLACYFVDYQERTSDFVNYQLVLGIGVLIGHIFPVYVGFRGGKGIATLLGIMIAIHPQAAFSCIGIFLAVFLLTKFVSLGSMISAICFPLLIILVFKSEIPSLVIFSIFIAIMVLITHQKNIERLLRKNESKANINVLGRNKSKPSGIDGYEEFNLEDEDQ